MVQSNEFKGDSLMDAVRQATEAYDKAQACEFKSQRRCNDLLLKMSGLSREAVRYSDEADRLRAEAESLRSEALRAGLISAASLLGGLAAGLLKGRRAARALGRMREGDLSVRTILEFLQIFSFIGAAAEALKVVENLRDAERLAQRADQLSSVAERTGDAYMEAFNEYDRLECGNRRGFTGT